MRTHQRARRDENESVDRFNIVLDFFANGRTGCNSTLTNTNDVSASVTGDGTHFNSDWHGISEHAVSQNYIA